MGSDSQPRPLLLIVTRDRYPPFRVDLTELFGRWLTPRFDIDWVMRRDGEGPATTSLAHERFLTAGPGMLTRFGLQVRQGFRVVRGRVDLVQVRDAALSALAFQMAAKVGRRPFVYWMSYPMAEGYRHRALSNAPPSGMVLRSARRVYAAIAATVLYRWILPRADHVFVQSEQMKADVAVKGIAPDRITAVPMGVSVTAYDPRSIQPAEDASLEGRRVLVYVGALDPEREIARLVQVLAEVVAAGFEAALVIVGATADAEREGLDEAAREAGVSERLLFTGHLPLRGALAYVRRADVCLAPFPVWPPTYLSATPTKLVEYLAMGRPVVASDHPDQRFRGSL